MLRLLLGGGGGVCLIEVRVVSLNNSISTLCLIQQKKCKDNLGLLFWSELSGFLRNQGFEKLGL